MGTKIDLECYKEIYKEFTRYDQNVDVVSCWESFLRCWEKNHKGYYFDRFPQIRVDDKSTPLTPDFTVFFNEKYGIIFECMRAFPQRREGQIKALKQLKKYDGKLPLRTSDNDNVSIPENCDIVLLLGVDVNEVATKLKKIFLEENDLIFNNNFIIVEYGFKTGEALSRYEFTTNPILEPHFTDRWGKKREKTLEQLMGEPSGYKTLKCYPKHFMAHKINEVLMNDKPPEIYLACYLWHKVFYAYLTEEQREIWNERNTNTKIEIEVNVKDLCDKLNNGYISNGGVKENWVRKTLYFLFNCNSGKKIDNDNFIIYFRNLVIKTGVQYQEGVQERDEFNKLVKKLTEIFCKHVEEGTIEEESDTEDKDKFIQETLT